MVHGVTGYLYWPVCQLDDHLAPESQGHIAVC
jgi:hypothetical protein